MAGSFVFSAPCTFVAWKHCCSSFALVAVPYTSCLVVPAEHIRGNRMTAGVDTVGVVMAGTVAVVAADIGWAAPGTALTDLCTALVALGMMLIVGIGVVDFSTTSDSAALLAVPCFL